MKEMNYMAVADEALRKIKRGAFLTVQAGEAKNTMTIGWVTFGFIWQKPILTVAVRDSRYTFGLIEKAADFTVTIPADDMKQELAFCGTKSGRDFDKFKECRLKTAGGQKVTSPVIAVPGVHYECKIVLKTPMNPALLDAQYDKMFYPQKDYHTMYYGEILACYETG